MEKGKGRSKKGRGRKGIKRGQNGGNEIKKDRETGQLHYIFVEEKYQKRIFRFSRVDTTVTKNDDKRDVKQEE